MVTTLAALLIAMTVWSAARRALREPLPPGRPISRLASTLTRDRPRAQTWLSQAGAAVTPSQFVLASGAVGCLSFILLLAISRTPAICIAPAAAATAAPYAYWANARRKRAAARSHAWPDVVRQLVGVIGPGVATLHDALEELSRSGPLAVRPAMSRYSRLAARLGDRRALEVLRWELADPAADPVLLALAGAVEEGTGTVLRVLGDLGAQITADLQLAEKIRTLQTQSRVANWGCFALPYGVLFLLCTANPAYRSYFSEPAGFAIVIAGIAVSSVGFIICRRLVNPIATGQRVFTGRA